MFLLRVRRWGERRCKWVVEWDGMDVSPAEIGSVRKVENVMVRKTTYPAQTEHASVDNNPSLPPTST